MRAALKRDDGTFAVEDIATPELPDPGWARARVRVAGICGTDLRHWRRPNPSLTGHVVGHELAGEVVEIGASVTGLRVGDRVVIETVLGDGTCEWCRVQRYSLCPSLYDVRSKSVSRAFAEFVVGPAEKFIPLPDTVSFEEAAVIDTLSVSLHAQHAGRLSLDDTVAILGAGPVGLGQLMLAKASGARVLITDIVESALDHARRLGADVAVNSREDDPVARVVEFTGGRGVDIAFECSGGPAMPVTLPQATRMARRGGAVVLVGGFDDGETAIPLEWQRIQKSEIRLVPSASFSFHGTTPEISTVVGLIDRGVVDAGSIVTHRLDLADINEAFEIASDKQKTGAVFVALTI